MNVTRFDELVASNRAARIVVDLLGGEIQFSTHIFLDYRVPLASPLFQKKMQFPCSKMVRSKRSMWTANGPKWRPTARYTTDDHKYHSNCERINHNFFHPIFRMNAT